MVSIVCLPVMLRLTRRNPRRKAFNLSIACTATFVCQGFVSIFASGITLPIVLHDLWIDLC